MPHFLIKNNQLNNNTIKLQEDDNFFHLVRVLRVKVGEKIKFIDDKQNIYLSEIINIDKKTLIAKVIEKYKTDRILSHNICLIQSILANDAQNLLIANATQTGIKEIYPVISDNTSVSNNTLKNKIEKWEKIAYENFKQCERGDNVIINPVSNLVDTIKKFKKENIIIYAEKYAKDKLNKCIKNFDLSEKIAVVIGPEGGFSENEFNFFKDENYNLVSLGSMIYKAPNAVIAGIHGLILNLDEN